MTTLSNIAATLEAFAVAEWAKVEAEAIKIEQEIEPVAKAALILITQQLGQLAVSTVMNLMTAAGSSLSGGEKLNLTATTIVEAAAKAGIAVASQDVTALAQNAYAAVVGTAPPSTNTIAQNAAGIGLQAVTDLASPK